MTKRKLTKEKKIIIADEKRNAEHMVAEANQMAAEVVSLKKKKKKRDMVADVCTEERRRYRRPL
eukprot:5756179-Ditylum_brightwellii.AAC.1